MESGKHCRKLRFCIKCKIGPSMKSEVVKEQGKLEFEVELKSSELEI